MCYHRRLHFILCNHVYDLEIVRLCSLASSSTELSPGSSPSHSSRSSSSDPALTSTTAIARCYPMVHPWTTYKVRRLCEACVVRRRRLDERVREVREGLEGVRGLLAGLRTNSEREGEGGGEGAEEDGEEEEEDGEGGIEEDEQIAYIYPFVR